MNATNEIDSKIKWSYGGLVDMYMHDEIMYIQNN